MRASVAVLKEHESVMRWLHRFQYVYHAHMAGTALAADNGAIDAVFDDSNLGEAIKPELAQTSLLAGAVAVPGEFGAGAAGCRLARVAGALWRGGRFGLILPSLEGGGWEHERGLPVTPSARGTRARMF